MILTSREADPEILRAVRDGVLIGDDVAQTIAAGFHSPAAVDEQITRLSHGKEFNPGELLARVNQLIKSDEFGASDALLDLDALREWVLTRVPHVEVVTIECTADEWSAWAGNIPDDRRGRDIFLVSEHADNIGEWVQPGDERYPDDPSVFETTADDGAVWMPGGPVATAVDMLSGGYTRFWAQELIPRAGMSGDYARFWAQELIPGVGYISRYDHPHTADVEYKTARVVGFSPEDQAKIYAAWKRP